MNRTSSPAPASAPSSSEERPSLGVIIWRLAASPGEVTAAAGLPARIRAELLSLLDGQYGEQAGELTVQVARVVRALLTAGAVGSLRLLGSDSHLLIELVSRENSSWPPGQAHTSGTAAAQGHYRTLGELRTQFVSWASLALPTHPGGVAPPAVHEADDVWS